MTFIDRSPGGVIIAANTLLYATVLTEIWMLTTASLFVMGTVMALIVVMAALLCRFIMNLMGSEEYITGDEPVPVQDAAPAAPERRRVPIATGKPALR
jgi:hypothetical protein